MAQITGASSASITEKSSRTIYIDADNGSDTTGNGSIGSPYETLATALGTVKRIIAHGVTIMLDLAAASASYTPIPIERICLGTGNLLIQGALSELETATADSGTATTLTDTGAFTGDSYAGKLLYISSGTGSGQYRLIQSHTDDVLTVVGRFTTSPDGTSVYAVMDWGSMIDGSTEFAITGGTVNIRDVACDDLTTTSAFEVGGGTLTLERVSYIASANSSRFLYTSARAKIELETCNIDGATYTQHGMRISGTGTHIEVYRSWIHGWGSYSINLDANGVMCRIRNGTIVDGTDHAGPVVSISSGAMLWCHSGTVNGAVDAIEIIGDAGNTYGIYADTAGGGINCSTTYITFTGAFSTANTGADAATMAFVET